MDQMWHHYKELALTNNCTNKIFLINKEKLTEWQRTNLMKDLVTWAAGMGNVMGGAMGQYQSQVTPNKSPLETAIGIASLGYGMTRPGG